MQPTDGPCPQAVAVFTVLRWLWHSIAAGNDGSQELLHALLPRGIEAVQPLNLHSMGLNVLKTSAAAVLC